MFRLKSGSVSTLLSCQLDTLTLASHRASSIANSISISQSILPIQLHFDWGVFAFLPSQGSTSSLHKTATLVFSRGIQLPDQTSCFWTQQRLLIELVIQVFQRRTDLFHMCGYTIPMEAPHVPIWCILQIFWFEFHQFLAQRCVSFFKHTCHSRLQRPVPFFHSAFRLFRWLLLHWGLSNFTIVSCRLLVIFPDSATSRIQSVTCSIR